MIGLVQTVALIPSGSQPELHVLVSCGTGPAPWPARTPVPRLHAGRKSQSGEESARSHRFTVRTAPGTP